MKMILVTGRTLKQGFWKEQGKFSENYLENVTVCYLDEDSMKKLGIEEGETVRISTKHGSTILKALKFHGEQPNIVFVPYSPWINNIVNPDTSGVGMPSLKGIPAEVEPVKGGHVLKLEELLRGILGSRNDGGF